MHMNLAAGCHSPRTMQIMMSGPPLHHLHPHLSHHNGGPPPNWSHPRFHQQQPQFGRLTPGHGGLVPPNHILPPGALIMNGSPPSGIRMNGMPRMNQSLSDGNENLTPERAKHRKNQLDKIQEMKSKITGGRGRGGKSKANTTGLTSTANIPPTLNGGSRDLHQQQIMMMNSSHGVAAAHHMMDVGPSPPVHMLPSGMRRPDRIMLEMNGPPPPPPPHSYINGPMPPGFHGHHFGPGPGDPYSQLSPHHPQSQAARDWDKMQVEQLEGKTHQMYGQLPPPPPPPYHSISPSSLTPPIATTSTVGSLGSNGQLLSPRIEPRTVPRLYKVGQPEKFIPDSLSSPVNKKLPGNVDEVQLTASPTQMDYNEFSMNFLFFSFKFNTKITDLLFHFFRYGR